jgi:hypothetical protein
MNKWGGGNPADYWVDGLSAVSKFRTLSEYDFVVVMPPNTVRDIIYGPSFPGWSPNQFAGLKAHFGGAVGGADQRNKEGSTGWIWLSHEIGHTMGFEHQYGYYPQPIWDLMDNVYIDTAPGLFGWHRFMQGWLEDKSVICLPMLVDGSTQKLQISPLEGMSESPKLALIKFDSASLYGVEYRLKSEFDKLPEEAEGVLIYRISPTVGSNQNALRLLKTAGPKSQSGQIYGTLKVGEQISSGSLNFKVTKASSAGAEIEISR